MPRTRVHAQILTRCASDEFVSRGSKAEILATSRCFALWPRQRTSLNRIGMFVRCACHKRTSVTQVDFTADQSRAAHPGLGRSHKPLHSVQDLKQELGRITEECSGDQAYEAESNGAYPAVSLPTIYGAERYARDNHANGPDHSKCDFKKFEDVFCLLLKRRRSMIQLFNWR
jgi:hypothetical protein